MAINTTEPGSTCQFKIPKTCKAGVVYNEGPSFELRIEDVVVPEPDPDEVLIKLNVTGLCYSDIHYMLGDLGVARMSSSNVRSPGHEGAGVVVKLGSNVKNWKVGDRAGVKPVWDTCGSCELCRSDKETYCSKTVLTGLHVAGTYQQYITSPARYTTAIPDEVPDEVAAPIMCSASTILRSLEESRLRPGDWAVFPGGGGGVGIQGVQLAKAMGLRPIAVDTGDVKRELCLKMGAEHFVDFGASKDVAQEIIALCGGVGAHAVFVTAPQAYPAAISFTGQRAGAKVMCIGLPSASDYVFGAHPSQFVFRNLSVVGTLVGSMQDTARALEFAQRVSENA
ncbi:hypothetical protein LOZ66_004669 [Ophidiomyces ophidiicola]|nr:hypothetical protein LOZ66_004669 [Ophidiomyces ophidiicola]